MILGQTEPSIKLDNYGRKNSKTHLIEARCLEKAYDHWLYCKNTVDQPIATTFVATGAVAVYPMEFERERSNLPRLIKVEF